MIRYSNKIFKDYISLIQYIIDNNIYRFPISIFPHSKFFYIKSIIENKLKRNLNDKEIDSLKYILYKDLDINSKH